MTGERRLPAVGDVRRLPERVEIDMVVDGDLLWFDGHFPNFPILPGVVQLDWALAFAREYLALDAETTREFEVKYKAGIFPGDRITLTLHYRPENGRLSFEFRGEKTVRTSGHMTLCP